MNKPNLILIIVTIFVALTLSFLSPLAILWAVNQLFSTNLDYSFLNWLAVITLWFAINLACKASVSRK